MSLSACREDEKNLQSNLTFPLENKCTLPQLADQLMSALQADGIAIATYLSIEAAYLICLVSRGELAPPVGALLEVSSGISGRCVRENRMLHSYDTKLDPRVDQDVCERMGIRSLAIIPLYRDSLCIGVLEVFSKRPAAFEGASLRRFEEEALSIASLIPIDAIPVLAHAERSKDRGENGLSEPLNQGSAGMSGEVVSSREATTDFAFRSFEAIEFGQAQRFARRYLPWIAASAAAVILGVTAPRFIFQFQRSFTSAEKKIEVPAEMTVTHPRSEQPSTSAVVPVAATDNPDERKASMEKLLSEAKAANPIAQFFLAVHYLNGSDVERDRATAAAWDIIAGFNGNQAAKQASVEITHKLTQPEVADMRFQIGKMFRDGVGTSRDLISAYSWFALAKAAGHPHAAEQLQDISRNMTSEQISEAHLRATRWQTSQSIKSPDPDSQMVANTLPAR